MMRRVLKNGQVYFAQAGASGFVKIGFSACGVRGRLRQLQTGCPERLRLLGTVKGNQTLEKTLHSRFKHLKVHGEWFYPGFELLDYVRTAASMHQD